VYRLDKLESTETLITSAVTTVTRFLDMGRKRPGLLAVKKHVARELLRDPFWRKKLDNARTTAEAFRIIRG